MTPYVDYYLFETDGNNKRGILFDTTLGIEISMIILKYLKKEFPAIPWTEVLWIWGGSVFLEMVGIALCFFSLYGWWGVKKFMFYG